MALDRREFLRNSALLLGTSLVWQSWPARTLFALETSASRIKRRPVVFIFQRGACDGLSLLPPVKEKNYYAWRPSIAIPQDQAIALEHGFALHPACAPLASLWEKGEIAFLPMSGSPDTTRSHFDAQDYFESGTPGVKSTADGFLNRALQAAPEAENPLRAVALQNTMPRSLQGDVPALATPSLAQFQLRGFLGTPKVAQGFEGLYESAVNQALRGTGKETFDALAQVKKILASEKESGLYPKSPLANALKESATLIKANAGLELAVTEVGGWDTHVGQGAEKGQLANQFGKWSEAIAAFAQDLGPRFREVVLVSVTEFGRTAKQNGSNGTDHGHGSVFVAAGGVKKGVYVPGQWNGLEEKYLFEERDVPVFHDYRDLFAEILQRQWAVRDFHQIFPGFKTGKAPRFVG